jgi:hypothetical protein
MGDFVVGVNEHDEFSGGAPEREAFAFLHVFALVVKNDRAVFFSDVACAVDRVRIGQNDFIAFARISLPRDGREAVVQQCLGVQRRDDEAESRWIIRTGLHGMSLADGGRNYKSALHAGFLPFQGNEPDNKKNAESTSGGDGHRLQQCGGSFSNSRSSVSQ